MVPDFTIDGFCGRRIKGLLQWLVEEVLEKEAYRTGDLGGKANTISCGSAVADAI